MLAVVAGVGFAGPSAAAERSPLENPEPVKTVRVHVDGAAMLADAQEAGIDFSGGAERVPTGIEADAVVTHEQELQLVAMGAEIVTPSQEFAWSFRRAAAAPALLRPPAPTVRIARADWFTTKGQGFLYVEARTADGAQTMTLENDGGEGTQFAFPRTMSRFNDSGVYMFHRNLFKLDQRPSRIRVTSSTGGEAIGAVSDWLEDVTPLTETPGYKSDFVDGYQTPQDVYARFEEIAQEHPDIAEIVTLPNRTNGYQRKAQAIIGGTRDETEQSAVVVSSAAWGHEGGNGITVETVERPGADLPLSVEVAGKAIRVLLAKDSSGALASTAAQVADALETQSQGLIDRAHPYRDNEGTGIVQPTSDPVVLTDFLDDKREGAPAGDPARGPFTVRALRIGKHRDGSKPGVLIQANDHAREWVPITITLETAERLVRNYPDDPATKDIVENTDVFLIPSNNPDGANFSFYNFASQRRNMTNHCPDEDADPGRRTRWGVDLNRNYRVGSGFDGYDGASTDCTRDTFQGPSELSEPESQNIIWLVEHNRNIKFMMSVHSNGGQLFWQPGAYIADGRITTPRPPLGHEAYYWQSASRILSQVRAARQTVVTPENVGGSSDVLYSSAGNVREDLYFNYGIFAFGWEVGGSVYDPESGRFVRGSFQPPWPTDPDAASGHSETMEYANGVIEMFRIAADWGRDKQGATTTLTPGAGQYDHPIGVRFDTSEPATIYYTTDGSRPTMNSPRYEATEFREPGETLWVEQTTTFKWFSVDAAGNVEAGYDPANPETQDNYRSATIEIGEAGEIGGTVPPTLSLTLGGPASFGAFVPGVADDYTASTSANVVSTAGEAALSASDPGHLANGAFTLPEPLQVAFSKSSWDGPVSNDPVTITFTQHIGADDALRTGSYSKTLTFTLSTTSP
ncbi:MAG TPA: M14 family metallopeptidase [Solirubrobacter sp.]|nr:M14 family metallopeptidase [Solirubrobacter sp.]